MIQRELGEGDGQQSEIEGLSRRIEEAGMPLEAHEKALHELGRLEIYSMAAEAVVVRLILTGPSTCRGMFRGPARH